MEVDSVLVTGANRGLGLEFVRQLVAQRNSPRYVFATYRCETTIKALEEIKLSSKKSKVILIKLDVTVAEDVAAVRERIQSVVGEEGLTLLINNAGVAECQNFFNITPENLLLHFNTNTVAPIMITKELLPLLERSAQRPAQEGLKVSRAAIVNISSTSGCIERTINESDDFLVVFGYKISKAALNMAMRAISVSVQDKGVLVVQINPGWVKTDMGTQLGLLEPEESVRTMIQTIARCTENHHGAFINLDGARIEF